MIETTIDSIDGVQFIKDFKLVPPYERENGVIIERVTERCITKDIELIIKALGLKQVSYDYRYRARVYAFYPLPFLWYKVVKFIIKSYWLIIRFLYNNGRVFKQIPERECFSWKYFTPYTWFKR